MQSGIKLTKIWADEDVLEIKIEISDGTSLFCHKAYLGHIRLEELVADLRKFKDQVHGGIYDITIGHFGLEYASGALHARLHFRHSTKLYITVHAQGDFQDFSLMKVASETTLYFCSAPALLEEFIGELAEVSSGKREEAFLQAV